MKRGISGYRQQNENKGSVQISLEIPVQKVSDKHRKSQRLKKDEDNRSSANSVNE